MSAPTTIAILSISCAAAAAACASAPGHDAPDPGDEAASAPGDHAEPADGAGASSGAGAGVDPQRGPSDAEHRAHRADEMPHRFDDPAEWEARFEARERAEWQQPERVVAALDLRGDETVVDIGAGTGYFAVRFAQAVPRGRVVGVDVEPAMVDYLEARAQEASIGHLTALLGRADSAGLEAIGERADLVFLCNTYHHIGDREAYFRDLRPFVREDGRLVVVDFRPEARRGPPPAHKIDAMTVVAELAEAGWTFAERHTFLSDQYVLVFEPAVER